MPSLTALIHARNDARRIGRALESLRPCDQFVVVDHGSTDETSAIARVYGAVVIREEAVLASIRHDWVLLLEPNEALSEALESTLYQWKEGDPGDAAAFAVRLREETPAGWELRAAETRLVQRSALHGTGALPRARAAARFIAAEEGRATQELEGDLLRFRDS